jgi:hypothetical protein
MRHRRKSRCGAGRPGFFARRQAPGTWLPLKVKRGSDTVELVAKFPPQAE